MSAWAASCSGSNTARFEIWDGMRAIDYLQSRPEIDPQRIGCTGNSGGGTQTSYLMALDDRIHAAAPSCYITSLPRLLATIGPQDSEQHLFGQLAVGHRSCRSGHDAGAFAGASLHRNQGLL